VWKSPPHCAAGADVVNKSERASAVKECLIMPNLFQLPMRPSHAHEVEAKTRRPNRIASSRGEDATPRALLVRSGALWHSRFGCR
jgi:hypothetical protein